MKREDDYLERGAHLGGLSDGQLRERFWELAEQIVRPLLLLGYEYTTPAVERSVLMRMGFSGAEAKLITKGAIKEGLMRKGCGNIVWRLALENNVSIREAGLALANGNEWDTVERIIHNPPEDARAVKTGAAVPQPTAEPRTLSPGERLDIREVTDGIEAYAPRRRGWKWREGRGQQRQIGDFVFHQTSDNVKASAPLPGARGLDPQPDCVITAEIITGCLGDDLRNMRIAAYNGADNIMFPCRLSRGQVRAVRKALDMFEGEVGRPINLHSYISGLEEPDVAVMYAEEGVGGAQHDLRHPAFFPDADILGGIVDACEAKRVIAWAGMLQTDGAYDAQIITHAQKAWNARPERMARHAVNTLFSRKAGIPQELIAFSATPTAAPPAPCMRVDLPYVAALKDFFADYKMHAQQYALHADECSETVTHTLNLVISRLTGSDIPTTAVPQQFGCAAALNTARQTLSGMDGIGEMVTLDREGALGREIRELKERAILFLEEIIETGGYINAIENGFFADSGYYPERCGDGITARSGGGPVFERDADYFAPVTAHYGYNNVPAAFVNPSDAIGGDTLLDRSKIVFADGALEDDARGHTDNPVTVAFCLPGDAGAAEAAALERAGRMGLANAHITNTQVLHPSEGTLVTVEGRMQ
jgi:D-ornithine 4,5-aminomutase subunit beta